jgi:hypothetical protein
VSLLDLFRPRRSSVALATRAAGAPSAFAPAAPTSTALAPPTRRQGGGYTWTLEAIRSARDSQIRGVFDQPVRLAEAFRTNDAMFVAYQTRVSTQAAIRLLWRAADTDAGRELAPLAERLVLAPQHARESILGTLANHGIAIGYVQHTTEDDPERGPVVRMTLTEWPLEFVRYNPSTCTLETCTRDNGTITITHGDGRWVVFRKFGVAPWTQDACVLPGALVWAAHGGCLSDWAGASFSHGSPKVVGELREGVTLQNADGTLTPDAQAVLNTLAALVGGEAGAGIMPAGSKANLLYNGSTAWQVFKELGLDRAKAAQRIYLGTDATLGSQGGAPGVDIAALFNVASTRVQGDLEALERGYREGMIEPWARMHGFAAADLPALTYAMPDADGERRATQEASGIERLAGMVKAMKDTGLDVTQDTINALVNILGVSVPCTLAAAETKAVPLQLAPTDIARVVKVREARAAQGLPALGDARDELTISALEAQSQAPTAPGAPPGGAPGGGGAPPGGAPGGGGAPPAPAGTPGAPAPLPLELTRTARATRAEDGWADEYFEEEYGDKDYGKSKAEGRDGDGDGKLDEAEKARKALAANDRDLAAYTPDPAPMNLFDRNVESLGGLPIEDGNDRKKVDAIKESPEFRETGRFAGKAADDPGARGITIVKDGDGPNDYVIRDGRHRLVAAQEIGRPDVWGNVVDGRTGEDLYQGPLRLDAHPTKGMTPAQIAAKHAEAEAARPALEAAIAEHAPAEKPDPKAIQTGPEGGQYYVNETGEKEYV